MALKTKIGKSVDSDHIFCIFARMAHTREATAIRTDIIFVTGKGKELIKHRKKGHPVLGEKKRAFLAVFCKRFEAPGLTKDNHQQLFSF